MQFKYVPAGSIVTIPDTGIMLKFDGTDEHGAACRTVNNTVIYYPIDFNVDIIGSFEPVPGKRSRIDIIGQNGPTGDHYNDRCIYDSLGMNYESAN